MIYKKSWLAELRKLSKLAEWTPRNFLSETRAIMPQVCILGVSENIKYSSHNASYGTLSSNSL